MLDLVMIVPDDFDCDSVELTVDITNQMGCSIAAVRNCWAFEYADERTI